MAKAVRISESSVLRIWRRHGIRPHQLRTFKVSNDPQFVKDSACRKTLAIDSGERRLRAWEPFVDRAMRRLEIVVPLAFICAHS